MRAVKSDDLQAILDFVYFGQTSVYQDNLESFLAVAEELQLRGLMGKEESAFEDSQIDDLKIPLPTLDEPACKQEKDISNQQHPPSSTKLGEAKETVRARKEISEGLREMERQTHLKMEKTSRTTLSGPIYKCKACGKEGRNAQLKAHIQANHLEGFSIPCNFCEKTFRSKCSLKGHKSEKEKKIILILLQVQRKTRTTLHERAPV